jgi:SAM-dependent methyltransferase
MHPEAYAKMDQLLTRVTLPPGANVCDLGSLDVNGNYRPLIEGRGWNYLGVDIRPGPNVDEVIAPYRVADLAQARFDLIISGSTLEHVREPWIWMDDAADALLPGGKLIIITHHNHPYHEYPVDCFRFYPEGFRALFDCTGKLHRYDISMYNPHDIYAVAERE